MLKARKAGPSALAHFGAALPAVPVASSPLGRAEEAKCLSSAGSDTWNVGLSGPTVFDLEGWPGAEPLSPCRDPKTSERLSHLVKGTRCPGRAKPRTGGFPGGASSCGLCTCLHGRRGRLLRGRAHLAGPTTGDSSEPGDGEHGACGVRGPNPFSSVEQLGGRLQAAVQGVGRQEQEPLSEEGTSWGLALDHLPSFRRSPSYSVYTWVSWVLVCFFFLLLPASPCP